MFGCPRVRALRCSLTVLFALWPLWNAEGGIVLVDDLIPDSVPRVFGYDQVAPTTAKVTPDPGAALDMWTTTDGKFIWETRGFDTGASAYYLDSVTLHLVVLTADTTVRLDIYGDNANQPGELLGTLKSPDLALGARPDAFTAQDRIYLAPESRYWAVLKAPTGGVLWEISGGHGPWGHSEDGGESWIMNAMWGYDMNPPTIRVEANVVPEPASIVAWSLLGVVGLAVTRRRRGRAA